MQVILIILAVIFIPIIINVYLFAIALKLNGKKNITIKMVFDEMEDMLFMCTFPVASICGMIVVIVAVSYELVKNVRLL